MRPPGSTHVRSNKLGDAQKRLEVLGLKPAQLAALDDPFLKLAAEMEKELKIIREDTQGLRREAPTSRWLMKPPSWR